MKNKEADYQIPMIVTKEVIRDFDIPREQVTQRLIGNQRHTVAMIDATKDVYDAYMRPEWAAAKREQRGARCEISGKNGKLIRCPDDNRCEGCPYASRKSEFASSPISMGQVEQFNVASNNSMESEIEALMNLEYLIRYVAAVRPEYGDVLQMLFDMVPMKEMEERLQVKPTTLRRWIANVRELAQTKYEK